MATYKRTTTKTGPHTKRTRTISSTGKITESYSSKPPGKHSTRRTVSHSNGKVRTTHSTKLGGGYTSVTSKTKTLVSKPRGGRRSRSGGGGDAAALLLFVLPLLLTWEAAKGTVTRKEDGSALAYYFWVFLWFVFYTYILCLVLYMGIKVMFA